MQIMTLGPMDRAHYGFTHRVKVTYADVAALGASASAALQIFPSSGNTVPAGTRVKDAQLRLVTAFDFSDAGITSLLAEVGDGGDPNRFVDQTEVAVDGTEVFNKSRAAATCPFTYAAADGIDLTLTAANGGSPLLSECTSGELEVYLSLDIPSELTALS